VSFFVEEVLLAELINNGARKDGVLYGGAELLEITNGGTHGRDAGGDHCVLSEGEKESDRSWRLPLAAARTPSVCVVNLQVC
jgi:hypothetical protein